MEQVSEEDYALVRQFVVLDKIMPILSKSRADIEASKELLRSLYASSVYLMMQEAGKEMQATRLAMNRQKIRIVGEDTEGNTIRIRFTCRGEAQVMEISRQQLKNEIGEKLAKMMTDMVGRVQDEK